MRARRKNSTIPAVPLALGILAGVLFIAVTNTVWAQTMIVQTATVNALRESVAVYAHRVNMETGQVVPGVTRLPAPRALSGLLTLPSFGAAITSTGTAWKGREALTAEDYTFLSLLDGSPFRLVNHANRTAVIGWYERAELTFPAPAGGDDCVIVTGTQLDANAAWRGRLTLLRASRERGAFALREDGQWPLPGPPVAAAAYPALGRVAVLCKDAAGTGAVLHIRDVLTGQTILAERRMLQEGEARFGTEGAAIAWGEKLFVMTTGYALDAPGGDPASWLHMLDPIAGETLAAPLQLPGSTEADDQSMYLDEDRLWLVTRLPGTSFGYVHEIRISESELELNGQYSLGASAAKPVIAFAPNGADMAVAAGDRVEIWRNRQPGGQTIRFDAPVSAMNWHAEGLFVAAGNTLQRVDSDTGTVSVTARFMSGILRDFTVIPDHHLSPGDEDGDGVSRGEEAQMGTDPDNPDTDNDGIADGVDPQPLRASGRLDTPAYVTFHGEAAGQELRVLLMEAPFAAGDRYRLNISADAMPWLRVSPRTGNFPDVAYLGVDPSAYDDASQPLDGKLTVRATNAGTTTELVGSPAVVEVRVKPKPSPVRRILWVVESGEASSYANLRGFLSGAPGYFSHEIAPSGYAPLASDYTVAVISARKALEGTVTRQALLDFVEAGGALLLLMEHIPDAAPPGLSRWLNPLGITLDVTENARGPYTLQGDDRLVRHWQGETLQDGAYVAARPPAEGHLPATPGSEQCALATAFYGRGRIAVLASSNVLREIWDARWQRARFAADLFRWLARAPMEAADDDGDGLRNELEDRNGNGAVDPGETDPFSHDSDGDGVPDGAEDLNKNGQVDEGETSPLNVDSDGDGTWDGADLNPVPPPASPHITRVEPAFGPAEGGTDVLVGGRNFAPNSEVWFGAHQASESRSLGPDAILTVTPPAQKPSGDAVEVRVTNPAVALSGTLPGGFVYTPVSQVALTLRAMNRAQDGYSGSFAIHMDGGPGVAVSSIALRVDVTPPDGLEWTEVESGALARYAGRNIVHGSAPHGGLWVNASEGTKTHSTGELAVVTWTRPTAVAGDISVRVGWSRILAPTGHPLDIHFEGSALRIPAPTVAERRIRENARGADPDEAGR